MFPRLNLRRRQKPVGLDPETPLLSQRYVVVDTELTTLERRLTRVLSIGAIAMQGTKILIAEQFYREVNPGVAIPEETVKIHGLRPADVERGEPPVEALNALREFAGNAVLVGHFVSLDMHALKKELGSGGSELKNAVVDTARVHRWILRHSRYTEDLAHRYENVDLVSLARLYQLPVQDLHHALSDAFLTAQLWQKLICELEVRGIRTVGKLLRIER